MAVSFRSKLLVSHAAVALAGGLLALVVTERALSGELESQLDKRLTGQAQAVAQWLDRARHHDELAGRLSGVVGARVSFLDKHGIALGDSQRAPGLPAAMDSEGSPPEVAAARDGEVGHATRYSAIDHKQIRYVAVGASRNLVVRLGAPLGEIEQTRTALRRQLAGGIGISLAIAAILGAVLAAALTRRLRATSAIAERIGRGQYDAVAEAPATDEVGVVARTLASAAAELRETESRRREFLANVAHELRTPVTSIRGFAETLASGPVEDATRAEFLHTIHRNAVRISALVDDLLRLEALDANNPPPARAPIDVGGVIRHVIETAQQRIEETGATIAVSGDRDVTVTADEDRVERIVQNLVDNALAYGGAAVAIEVAIERRADLVTVTVADSGPGIPADQLARVFDRFYRGAQARDSRGSGLGLPIARQLAESMGGTLRGEARPGGGARFVLELPA